MAKALIVIAVLGAIFFTAQATPYGLGGFGAFQQRADLQAKLLEYREICVNRSGSDEGFQKSLVSLGPALRCLTQNIDVMQLTQDLALARQSSENRKTVFDNYCPRFNESVSCFEDVLEGVAMCTAGGSDDIEITKNMYQKMVHNFIELMCKDEGHILIEAATPEFKECLSKIKQHSVDCKTSKLVAERPISQFGEEECSEIKRSRDCIQQEVNTCSVTTFMDIFDAFYQPLAEATDCKRFSAFTDNDGNGIESNQYDTILQNND